ncbi:site-specific integrase [Priestia sp. Y58]|uniref:tyrosine-type recombinase/integrase n=1 Tax=Priestia sp. Y58 TaxID=2922804 RepID=UPI002405BC4E|nr:site-specific integrase [Priestia sp. Y58]MDG0029960.1 site-specific integrase [Priestia sp. Y58]
MKIVRENDNNYGFTYEIYRDGQLVDEIDIRKISKLHKGRRYIFLLDSNRKVIEKVFDYLNGEDEELSINSREQHSTALKLLYSFSRIINKDIECFSRVDISNLSRFILGLSSEGNYSRWELKTSRAISTHQRYFEVFRSFLKKMDINNSIFFEKSQVKVEKNGYGMMEHAKKITVERYKTSVDRHSNPRKNVPKYISVEEYRRIINYINDVEEGTDFINRNLLIIDLMFTQGMRLGEVLGLTLEDIHSHPENRGASILKLRNRMTDRPYQSAKGAFKPKSKSVYTTTFYQESYQQIVLPELITQRLKAYINESRNIFEKSEKYLDNTISYANGDSVENEDIPNYYIFLNKNGSPLSASGWSKYLKNLFVELEIPIDKGNKRHNLSHRFRHGYAMFLIKDLKKDVTEVQKLMRHKSLASTMMYFNPTEEEILKSTEKIQVELIRKVTEGQNE